MNKIYQKVGWKNEPSVETPVNDENLGRMDNAIDILDDRIVELNKTKASQADYLQLQTVVSSQSKALSSAQEQISSLNGKTDQTNEAVNVLGQTISGISLDVENLKSKTDKTNSEVEELKAKSDSISEAVSSLQEKAEETDEVLTTQGKALRQTVDALDNRIKKFYTNNLGENHIADSDDGVFRNIRIEGKSEQFTTTGAQLIAYPFYETTKTENGLTFTDNKDGSITVNGTASAYTTFIFKTRTTGFYELPAGEYTLSGCPSGGNSKYALKVSKTINKEFSAVGSDFGNGISFSVSEDFYPYGIYFDTQAGVTFNNLVVKPMVNAGTTPLPWEPYTGGQPSPNPKYPQEIKSADGMYTGKNKLPNDATTTTISGVTFTVNEDGSITANGRATASIRFDISKDFMLPQGNYLLSGTDIYHTLSACTISDNINDGTGAINIVTSGGSDASIKVTNDNTKHNVYIDVSSGKIVSNETIYPMIRPANTDSEYEPYTGGVPAPAPNKLVMKVNSSNLLDLSGATTALNTSYEIEEDGRKITVTTTNRYGNARFEVNHLRGKAVKFNYDSVRFVGDSEGVASCGVQFMVRTADGTTSYMHNRNTPHVIPNDATTVQMHISANNTPNELSSPATVTVEGLRIMEADVNAPWTPYVPEQLAPIPVTLRSVGEGENAVRDVMYVYADGTGKLVQRILVLLPTDFRDTEFEGDGYRIGSIRSDIIPSSAVLCTHLSQNNAVSQYSVVGDYTSTGDSSGALKVRFKQSFADINECIAYMESKNMRFLVAVQTPIETALTAEQVKALFELRTHYGGTHISFESENGVEPIINFDYACSLENFVEYVKQQMGDDRKFVYDMEDRLAQGNKALEQYLDAMLGLEG